jgi:hypothetical protein
MMKSEYSLIRLQVSTVPDTSAKIIFPMLNLGQLAIQIRTDLSELGQYRPPPAAAPRTELVGAVVSPDQQLCLRKRPIPYGCCG